MEVASFQEYTAINKEVKKSVKPDKRSFLERLAEEVEDAAAGSNMKGLNETTTKLLGRYLTFTLLLA